MRCGGRQHLGTPGCGRSSQIRPASGLVLSLNRRLSTRRACRNGLCPQAICPVKGTVCLNTSPSRRDCSTSTVLNCAVYGLRVRAPSLSAGSSSRAAYSISAIRFTVSGLVCGRIIAATTSRSGTAAWLPTQSQVTSHALRHFLAPTHHLIIEVIDCSRVIDLECEYCFLTAGRRWPRREPVAPAMTRADSTHHFSVIVMPRRRLTAWRRHNLGAGAWNAAPDEWSGPCVSTTTRTVTANELGTTCRRTNR